MVRPRVIELVGPAGSGKSTLALDLCERDAQVRGPISLWGLPRMTLIASAFRLTAFWLAAAVRGRAPQAEALAHMIRLDALRQVVDRAAAEPCTVLLDEGPVFGLGWLEVFFPANGDYMARQWRERTMREWAERIDVVIVLDAANPVLAERIQTRAKPHTMKGRTPPEIYTFTERYRRALGDLVEALGATGVDVWKVTTDSRQSDEAAELVSTRIRNPAPSHG